MNTQGRDHGYGHSWRHRRLVHRGQRRCGQNPQGAGVLHRRRRERRDADQRGDEKGVRDAQLCDDGRARHHRDGAGRADSFGGHLRNCRCRRADQCIVRRHMVGGESLSGSGGPRRRPQLQGEPRGLGPAPQSYRGLHGRCGQTRDFGQRSNGGGARRRRRPRRSFLPSRGIPPETRNWLGKIPFGILEVSWTAGPPGATAAPPSPDMQCSGRRPRIAGTQPPTFPRQR